MFTGDLGSFSSCLLVGYLLLALFADCGLILIGLFIVWVLGCLF